MGSRYFGDGGINDEFDIEAVCRMVSCATEGGVDTAEGGTSCVVAVGEKRVPTTTSGGGLSHGRRSVRPRELAKLTRDHQKELLAKLQQHPWSINHHRKDRLGTGVMQSVLGLYTRQGLGITKETKRTLELIKCLHRICSVAQCEYTTIVISKLQVGDEVAVHTDKYNFANAVNLVLSIGDYTGGALEVQQGDGSWMEIPSHGRLVQFDQRLPHRVLPVTYGVRYSVVFLTVGRLQAVPEEIWNNLKVWGFPVRKTQELGRQLQKTYEAAQLPVEAWTGETPEDVVEDFNMAVCVQDDVKVSDYNSEVCVQDNVKVSDSNSAVYALAGVKVQPVTMSLDDKDEGLCLTVSSRCSQSPSFVSCLHEMGFTHRIQKGKTVEYRTRDCFHPGTEELNQTKWLNAKEEAHILEKCHELYPMADGGEPDNPEGEEEEIVAQLPDEIESDEEDGPPTTSWEPSSKERTALDLLHRNLGHPPAHKLAKVLKLGG
eukprot:6485560-Amphidinium_carterae.1